MSAAAARLEPRLLRSTPGRMRVALGGWDGGAATEVDRSIAELPGVTSARASAVTRNALVCFDREATSAEALLAELHRLRWRGRGRARAHAAARREPRVRRARIAVRGIDRDPRLARAVVERLRRRPGVRRAVASATTGRVLVEVSEHEVDFEDLLSELADLELPEVDGEDRPSHPLDPAPLIQGSARLIGSALGLGVLAARRARERAGAPVGGGAPAVAAGVVGTLEGLPFVRDALREALGRDRAQLALGGAAVVSLTLAGSPLGLALTGATALRLVTEVRARRAAWEDYERRLAGAAPAEPGAVVRLEAGDRAPLHGRVIEGAGSAIGLDGLPDPLAPGAELPAGARVLGGPFVVELLGQRPFTPQPRPGAPPPTPLDRYLALLAPASLACAGVAAVAARSLGAGLTALLLINPRPALIGAEAADASASARVLRAGVIVVGTRPERAVRRPDLLLLDGPRVLTDGYEATAVVPLAGGDPAVLGARAAAVAAAAGAHAAPADHPAVRRARERGEEALVLREEGGGRALAIVRLRPRLAPGVAELVAACRRQGIELALREEGDRRAARALARRADVPLIVEADLTDVVRERQRAGARVAVVSDSPRAAEAFEACDLAIGIASGRGGRFAARADLLAPDLAAVGAIVAAARRREDAVAASIGLSVAANVAGAAWGLRGGAGLVRASYATYGAALAAIGAGWLRLRGGARPRSLVARLVDPRPERWGRREAGDVLAAVGSSAEGLSAAEAAARRERRPEPRERGALASAALDQLRSPLIGVLGAGAALSLAVGALADVGIIGAVLAANVAIGAWQERQAGRAAEALRRMGAASARVLRDGEALTVPADEVVVGDVLLLAPGDHVAADARLLAADALELDEAALTGESLPVAKSARDGPDTARVVLEGSDVTVGAGRAVAVAVGERTRLGATAAALTLHETRESPLGARLDRLFRQGLPLVAAGGALVAAAGVLWGGQLAAQLALGASVAIAAVPEGLPLLAGVAEAAVARRLARRGAIVRRLASTEALGRVDVACADKTGTLTQGRLALRLLATLDEETDADDVRAPALRDLLRVAAQASPHPAATDAVAHPTDVAIVEGAERAGLGGELRAPRSEEAPFDPARAFHAARVDGRLCVKGAPEVLAPRCAHVRAGGERRPLDDAGRARLLDAAERLAARGLRVLMVAEGGRETSLEDPQELTALGFVGIADPLRPGVREAVARCRAAGVRLVMLTGDHPETARAIAHEAGIAVDGEEVLTGAELIDLDDGELDARLERATVIARITPLDKVRIVESLRRRGHTVAMTGDGVNDAPALRLADVGVAMGAAGTEVARQAADVVLADDDFATLVEALVEGRGFWRNVRRSLGLLLGGNLGELGLMAGASLLGGAAALTTRQILTVNLVTDVLPALAVAVQPPEHRDLSGLAREGAGAFDAPLRAEILRRGAATAAPALGAFLLAGALGLPAGTVAFGSVVATQLAQTLDVGRAEGTLTRPVLLAVGGSGGLLAATLTVAPLRRFLGLAAPGALGTALILASAAAAVALARALAAEPPAPHARPRPARAPAPA